MTINSLSYKLPETIEKAVRETFDDWKKSDKISRIWSKDAELWTNTDEGKWLGWLDSVETALADIEEYKDFAEDVKSSGLTDVLLMGMGGSSLCPEVLALTFGKSNFHVLDSTVPAQVRATEEKINLEKTLFIVSSKSGSTLEPNIFKQYFFAKLKGKVGRENAGKQFVAVTDPDSKLQKVAEKDEFRKIFFGDPAIGGRFSALSPFGLAAGAAMNLDVEEFLKRALEMVRACQSDVPQENPGAILGTILGVCQTRGKDKLTFFTSPDISDLGAWLEQLSAESTGKNGKAIIPVDREGIQSPEEYGDDRVFAYLSLKNRTDERQEQAVAALEQAGQVVIRVVLEDEMNLGQEFFRWEFAIAVAGAIMHINTFNQPDVEAAKIEAKKLTEQYEKEGKLPDETPFFEADGIKLFTDEKNVAELNKIAGAEKSLANYLKAHLNRIKKDDYFALLAYIEMSAENENLLQAIRHRVLHEKRVATCLGFGPRFLHSTGQAYKGGANNGVFLQVTADDAFDLQVPDQKYTFGVVKAAQARGDFQVLTDRNRRALRVHLGENVAAGLKVLQNLI